MKIPFGKYKGKQLEKLPRSYLEWIAKNLIGGDFHNYALAAKEILVSPSIQLEMQIEDLDKTATEWLKERGYKNDGSRI